MHSVATSSWQSSPGTGHQKDSTGHHEIILNERELEMFDTETICLKAIERLKNTTWFGVLEDLRRSEIMLTKTVRTMVKNIRLSSGFHFATNIISNGIR